VVALVIAIVNRRSSDEISMTTLIEAINSGKIRSIIVDEDELRIIYKGSSEREKITYINSAAGNIPQVLIDHGASPERLRDTTFNYEAASNLPDISGLCVGLLPIVLIGAFIFYMVRQGRQSSNQVSQFGRSQARMLTGNYPTVTLEDVAGHTAAKAEIAEIIDFLKEPEKYIRLGSRTPRGVLLVGPPGTGKTLMARAVAGEAQVPFFSISGSEFVEMFVGVGASRVRDLFERAKNEAPSIIFMDEIDAVGRHRGSGLGGGHDEREQTLNQILVEMDGFDIGTNVIVFAATNRPDVLDTALLRPGRFDRRITLHLPDRTDRLSILKIHCRGKPLDPNVELDKISEMTASFSGADLENLANEAAMNAAASHRKSIAMRDFNEAFDRIVRGIERPPLSDPNERRIVAYHEAGHAIVTILLPKADPIIRVLLLPRGETLSSTTVMLRDKWRPLTQNHLTTKIQVALAGRAAEQLVFGEVSTASADDLKQATEIAREMVTRFGMSETVGLLYIEERDPVTSLAPNLQPFIALSEQTTVLIDTEVRKILDQAYHQAYSLLQSNRDKLDTLAQELLDYEIVSEQRVREIMLGKP
jgi:cell division protease FtsH